MTKMAREPTCVYYVLSNEQVQDLKFRRAAEVGAANPADPSHRDFKAVDSYVVFKHTKLVTQAPTNST